jgi:CubicO group peptidase (beta-lactamase class C family)
MAPWRSVFRETGPVPPLSDESEPVSIKDRRRAGLAAVFGYPFVARPGHEFHYSDLGFVTLGAAASQLSGTSLDEAVRSRVTGPLGLDSLSYAPGRAGIERERIVPTSFDDDWRQRRCWGEVEDENAASLGGVAGHAGLFGTAREVARFGQAWLTNDTRLGLDQEIVAAATSSQVASIANDHGLGWQVRAAEESFLSPLSPSAFGHTGFTGTSLAIDPSRQLVVALLTNRVYQSRTHEGIEGLRAQVHEALAQIF